MRDIQEAAYRSVRQGLLEGTLRSPKYLSQRQLAATLNVDANVVRSVLERLEAERVLTRQPQSGTYIRRLDEDEFRRLYDIRTLIEPYAAARAAHLITRDQLQRVAAACRGLAELHAELECCASGDLPPEYIERSLRLEHAFHGTILEAAQAPEAAHIVENFRILMHVNSVTALWPREQLLPAVTDTVQQHRAIYVALRAGDAVKARQRMLRHLRAGFLDDRWTLERPRNNNEGEDSK